MFNTSTKVHISALRETYKKCTFLIDSLSAMASTMTTKELSCFLTREIVDSTDDTKLIALCHLDTSESQDIGIFKQLASAYVVSSAQLGPSQMGLEITQKKRSAKVVSTVEILRVNDKGLVLVEADLHTVNIAKLSLSTETKSLDRLAADLSFNVQLTDEQRKAKDSLQLPYLKAQGKRHIRTT